MDLLAKRYASPFFVLDEFIHLGQLHDFLTEFLKMISDEEIEKYKWEFFLHKVYDKSYEEYCSMVDQKKEDTIRKVTDKDIKDVCDFSQNILDGFVFEKE